MTSTILLRMKGYLQILEIILIIFYLFQTVHFLCVVSTVVRNVHCLKTNLFFSISFSKYFNNWSL